MSNIIRVVTFIILGLVPSFFGSITTVYSEETKRIGILIDGPYWENEVLISNVKKELAKLNGNRYSIVYPPETVLNGEHDSALIEKHALQMVDDQDLDVILTIGTQSASTFSNMDSLSVPVVAMSVQFPIDLGLLEKKSLKPKNPNWITSYDPSIATNIVSLFPKLTPFNKITAICPAFLCENHEEIIKVLEKGPPGIDMESDLLILSPENYSKQISKLDTPLVYVFPLYGFSETQINDVFVKLSEKNIPAYTHDGMYGIKKGALVSIQDYNFEKLGRNFALKVFDILEEIPMGKIQVKDFWNTRLIFNIETAREINYQIPLEFVDEATLYGTRSSKKELQFKVALQTALSQNYDIKVQSLIQNQAFYDMEITERQFYPQLFSDLSYDQDKKARADALNAPRGETKVRLSLEQKLFDRELSKNIESLKYQNEVQKKTLEIINQDITEQVGLAYMDNLSGEEIVDIRREFLNVIRKNQSIADLKFKLGETSRGDVIRLNIELENARIDLVNAQESIFRSRVQLNTLLNLPAETEHSLEYHPFNIEKYQERNNKFKKYFRTGWGMKVLRDFFTEKAYENSVELKSVEVNIRQVKTEKEAVKSKFLPTLDLSADVFQQVQESSRGLSAANRSAFDDKFENGWSAKFNLRFPLFTGGSRFKELNQANIKISEFNNRKENLKIDLAKRARTSLYNLYRSRINADRALLNVNSSQDNLSLQELAYSEGDAPIIDLLDAQSKFILSRVDAVQARYQFYKSLFNLFRVLGQTQYITDFKDQVKLSVFREELNTYYESRLKINLRRGKAKFPWMKKQETKVQEKIKPTIPKTENKIESEKMVFPWEKKEEKKINENIKPASPKNKNALENENLIFPWEEKETINIDDNKKSVSSKAEDTLDKKQGQNSNDIK